MYYNPAAYALYCPKNPETDFVEPSVLGRVLDQMCHEDNAYRAARELCQVVLDHFDAGAPPGVWWWAAQFAVIREALAVEPHGIGVADPRCSGPRKDQQLTFERSVAEVQTARDRARRRAGFVHGARARSLHRFDRWFETWLSRVVWERTRPRGTPGETSRVRGELSQVRRHQLMRVVERSKRSDVVERARRRLHEDALARVEYASRAADGRARRHIQHWRAEAEKYR